jgi:hypothetical protein
MKSHLAIQVDVAAGERFDRRGSMVVDAGAKRRPLSGQREN